MLDNKNPDEIREILDIAEDHDLDVEEAEHVKEIVDNTDLSIDEAVELRDTL